MTKDLGRTITIFVFAKNNLLKIFTFHLILRTRYVRMKYEIYILVELEKTYLLKIKVNLERISLDKDPSKILRGSLFLGHPLLLKYLTNILYSYQSISLLNLISSIDDYRNIRSFYFPSRIISLLLINNVDHYIHFFFNT